MLWKSFASLLPSLDQTYDRILCGISEDDFEYAARILQWLTFSARPLSIGEIAEAVAVDGTRDPAFDRDQILKNPLDALRICSSLVTIAEDLETEILEASRQVVSLAPDSVQEYLARGPGIWEFEPSRRIVSLAHYSVREYLVSDRIRLGPPKRYSMDETTCHFAISKSCLRYFSQLHHPSPVLDHSHNTSVLVGYSACFWAQHLKKSGDGVEELSELAARLLLSDKSAYLQWIEFRDPDYIH